jgi:GTP cyclohydrolase I
MSMATPRDYQVGMSALAVVIEAAIKAQVPEFLQSDVPAGLAQQIERDGAKAVIDAVDAHRAEQDSAKGMD